MVVMTNIELEQEQMLDEVARDRRVTDLLGFIGHELRTPLSSVAACAELLETADDPLERQVFASTMRRQISRLMTVFEAAMQATRTLDGDVADGATADVRSALERAAQRLAEFDSTIAVRVACVPLRSRAVMDAASLDLVLDNLVLNAARHSRGRTVVLAAEERAGCIEIRIDDDGAGVPAAMRETIFERGSRGHSSGGHGLGLYVASELVRRCGGEIGVAESSLGGASFRVTLRTGEASHGE